MPGMVLTTTSTVLCGHPPGKLAFVPPPVPKLTIGGVPVLLQTTLMAATIAGCLLPVPPAGIGPCVSLKSVAAGVSTKLTVGGVPVITSDLGGLTTQAGAVTAVPPCTTLTAI